MEGSGNSTEGSGQSDPVIVLKPLPPRPPMTDRQSLSMSRPSSSQSGSGSLATHTTPSAADQGSGSNGSKKQGIPAETHTALTPGSKDRPRQNPAMSTPGKSSGTGTSVPDSLASPSNKTSPDEEVEASMKALRLNSTPLSEKSSSQEPKPKTSSPTVKLSNSQRTIVEHVVERGDSLFFTGSAGTGKSVVLREIVRQLNAKLPPFQLAVTASTGIAAINIGGVTIHAFSGVGIARGEPREVLDAVFRSRRAVERWKNVQVLVIDENAELFDKIEFVARMLVEVFRQTDRDLVDLLSDVRYCRLTAEGYSLLNYLKRDIQYDDGVEPTHLYATRAEVDNYNSQRLQLLDPSTERCFHATFSKNDPALVKRLLDTSLMPQKLRLRMNAQVMLIQNHKSHLGLVNGSVGTVVGFDEKYYNLPIVQFTNNITIRIEYEPWQLIDANRELVISASQIPLILSYAM
eukprot:jgi/Hompol1/6656/HPOL_001218-RA